MKKHLFISLGLLLLIFQFGKTNNTSICSDSAQKWDIILIGVVSVESDIDNFTPFVNEEDESDSEFKAVFSGCDIIQKTLTPNHPQRTGCCISLPNNSKLILFNTDTSPPYIV